MVLLGVLAAPPQVLYVDIARRRGRSFVGQDNLFQESRQTSSFRTHSCGLVRTTRDNGVIINGQDQMDKVDPMEVWRMQGLHEPSCPR